VTVSTCKKGKKGVKVRTKEKIYNKENEKELGNKNEGEWSSLRHALR
jgi:hypothetical protein